MTDLCDLQFQILVNDQNCTPSWTCPQQGHITYWGYWHRDVFVLHDHAKLNFHDPCYSLRMSVKGPHNFMAMVLGHSVKWCSVCKTQNRNTRSGAESWSPRSSSYFHQSRTKMIQMGFSVIYYKSPMLTNTNSSQGELILYTISTTEVCSLLPFSR